MERNVFLRIQADLTEKGVIVVCAFVVHQEGKPPLLNKSTPFQIDTGADITTIHKVEADRIGINVAPLKRSPKRILTFGGPAFARILPNVVFIFNTNEGGKEFELEFMHIAEPPVRKDKKLEKIYLYGKMYSNLLGRDILFKYGFKLVVDFKTKEAYLER